MGFSLQVKSEYWPKCIWTPGFVTWVLLFSCFFLLSFLTLCLASHTLGTFSVSLPVHSSSYFCSVLYACWHDWKYMCMSSRWVICLSVNTELMNNIHRRRNQTIIGGAQLSTNTTFTTVSAVDDTLLAVAWHSGDDCVRSTRLNCSVVCLIFIFLGGGLSSTLELSL